MSKKKLKGFFTPRVKRKKWKELSLKQKIWYMSVSIVVLALLFLAGVYFQPHQVEKRWVQSQLNNWSETCQDEVFGLAVNSITEIVDNEFNAVGISSEVTDGHTYIYVSKSAQSYLNIAIYKETLENFEWVEQAPTKIHRVWKYSGGIWKNYCK